MSVNEILKEVLKDSLFYKNSGGGMTVSGGEPLMQPRFTQTLLKAAKEKNNKIMGWINENNKQQK